MWFFAHVISLLPVCECLWNCHRYVNKVMVHDLETGQKWHFLCNSWLSIDLGECTLDKVFPVATEMDLKRFRYVDVRQI